MQKRLAGINPNWSVLNPMTQISTLFTAATSSPIHNLRPTRIVESTVNKQEK
ncbi:MAG TPA: hypothetical protein VMD29_11325 [Terracidiphilus sp.]|nr:hypothetical protein [Terracidiphilus sp.]